MNTSNSIAGVQFSNIGNSVVLHSVTLKITSLKITKIKIRYNICFMFVGFWSTLIIYL